MGVNGRRLQRSAVLMAALFLMVQGARASNLMELYAQALQFDPSYEVARLESQVAGQSLREAKAGFKPTLGADIEATKVFQNIESSDNFLFVTGKNDYFNQRYTVTLIQPLWQPQANGRMDQARAEVRQAAARLAAAEQDLIYRLARAHFDYLAARDNLDFAVTESRAIQQQLDESEERLTVGLGSLTDVHEARARFALSQATEIEAQDILEEARLAIAEITGTVPVDLLSLGENFPLVGPDRPEVESWVEAASFQNPGIVALEAAVEIAEAEVRRQRAGFKPRLDLAATLNSADNGGNEIGGGGGTDIDTANIALRLGIPIYSAGRVSAQAESSRLRRRISQQELEGTRRRVQRETRTSFQGVVSGITRVQALTQSVFSQESVLSAREEGLRSGVDTGRNVLDARSDLFFALRDLAQARYLYVLNTLRLKQSAGILHENDLRQINGYLQ